MDKNEPKKWRTDYAMLLRCMSLNKTSQLLSQSATKQMKTFKAESKAVNQLTIFTERIESKTTLNQSIDLWNETIDQFFNQNNFLAAAECLESLSDIQLNYGSYEQKNESFHSLMRASKYYKRASEKKRAIIAIKKALTLVEFSADRDVTLIGEKYEECGALYKALNKHHLAKLNQSIGDFFGKISESDYIEKSRKISKSSKSNAKSSKPIPITSNSDSESDENQLKIPEVDDKQLIQQQIKEMMEKRSTSGARSKTSAPIDEESDYPNSDNNNEEILKPNSNYGSKNLLRKNMKKILSNISNDSEQSSDESPPKRAKNCVTVVKEKKLTTQITVAQSMTPTPSSAPQTQTKRKRRLKPKEESEELPVKRIAKLDQKKFIHYFEVDSAQPEKRLRCIICRDTVLSYRWSTITDHLYTRKHQQFVGKLVTKTLFEEFNNDMYSVKYVTNYDDSNEKHIDYNNGYNHYTNYEPNYVSYSSNTYSLNCSQMVANNDDNNCLKAKSPQLSPIPSTSTQMMPLPEPINDECLSLNLDLSIPFSPSMTSQINDQSLDDNMNRSTLNTPDPKFDEFSFPKQIS